MFGINKNGTKHKIGIVMPASYPSARVTFDPTVKNILPNTATDCQKAIDAVSERIYYKDFDVTTAAHSAVQPYTAYNSTTVGLSGYTPISAMPMGTSGARCLANLSTNDYSTLYVFTYGAQSVKIRVLYMKN